MSNVLVVAFDGLDHELIQRYSCEAIQQQEFGRIDNETGMSQRMTSELFASFLTGQNHEQHGVTGLTRFENDCIEVFESRYGIRFPLVKFKGLRTALYGELPGISGGYTRAYRKDDITIPTLFDEIMDSRSLNVPAWDPNPFVEWANYVLPKYGLKATLRYFESEQEKREQEFFEALEDQPYSFLMTHFHKPDALQDLFHKFRNEEDGGRIEAVYHEMEELTERILAKAKNQYDYIILMSDHGLPEAREHNKNAFYSCNRDLFGNKTPKITEFHDKILEIVEDAETGGLDI